MLFADRFLCNTRTDINFKELLYSLRYCCGLHYANGQLGLWETFTSCCASNLRQGSRRQVIRAFQRKYIITSDALVHLFHHAIWRATRNKCKISGVNGHPRSKHEFYLYCLHHSLPVFPIHSNSFMPIPRSGLSKKQYHSLLPTAASYFYCCCPVSFITELYWQYTTFPIVPIKKSLYNDRI